MTSILPVFFSDSAIIGYFYDARKHGLLLISMENMMRNLFHVRQSRVSNLNIMLSSKDFLILQTQGIIPPTTGRIKSRRLIRSG